MALLLVLAIICVVVVILKWRTSWKPEEGTAAGTASYPNAVYGAGELLYYRSFHIA